MIELSVGDHCLFQSNYDGKYYPCIVTRKYLPNGYDVEIILSEYPHYHKWTHNNHHTIHQTGSARLKALDDPNDIKYWIHNKEFI